jgi:hypothetical protein
METYVLCSEIGEGLRPSEATVTVKSLTGRPEFLRASRASLLDREGNKYLSVGVVHVDPQTGHCLIEFPEEADSGASRVWVPRASILVESKVSA